MAVDLAKLSLWLATLARDHPFTFLDHSLRSGDSLVGLTRNQIAYFNLAGSGQPTFVQAKLAEQMTNALRARRQILAAGDDMPPSAKTEKLTAADEALEPARLAGDLFVASFFEGSKARERAENRDLYLGLLEAWKQNVDADALFKIQSILNNLRSGQHPVTPFHWEIEFPEVFDGEKSGFDCIIGNPPFAGRTTIFQSNAANYINWLKAIHDESHGNADLVAHFFRRSFTLIRKDGTFGLIATNTIGQGDTRSTGLRYICTHDGTIYAARKRYKWPGQAAVVVSIVHVVRGELEGPFDLDGREVPIITAYLFHAGTNDDPEKLAANMNQSYQGCVVVGMGFTFDDTDKKGIASPIGDMVRLLESNPKNRERIFPYLGGEEINEDPKQTHHRYIINFGDMSEEEARNGWPELMAIVEERVKPERLAALKPWSSDKQKRADYWWRFSRTAKDLYEAIIDMARVIAVSRVGNAFAFCFLPRGMVYSDRLVVIAGETYSWFCAIQCRLHETWSRFQGFTLKDDFSYAPSDCFETFPFPEDFQEDPVLEEAGKDYYEFRADLMIRNNEGLTATYNRFHDPAAQDADILKLRELHGEMDQAVLDTYGWDDIQPVCGFGLDYLDIEDDDMPADLDVPEQFWWPTAEEALAFAARLPQTRRRLPWRYRWPEEIRDEVLARLLELNKQRAEEERRTGAAAAAAEKKKTKRSKRGRKKKRANTPTFIDLGEEEEVSQ
jgi:hypothetical protein